MLQYVLMLPLMLHPYGEKLQPDTGMQTTHTVFGRELLMN